MDLVFVHCVIKEKKQLHLLQQHHPTPSNPTPPYTTGLCVCRDGINSGLTGFATLKHIFHTEEHRNTTYDPHQVTAQPTAKWNLKNKTPSYHI